MYFLFVTEGFCYGFYGKGGYIDITTKDSCKGHDLIAELTWDALEYETIEWLCTKYEVCDLVAFQTLSALSDLLKHDGRIIKYFDLHFYNNPYDTPPMHCRIDLKDAINGDQPNLLKTVKVLLKKFHREDLSFVELSYLVHLLADLHQPFHGTIFD